MFCNWMELQDQSKIFRLHNESAILLIREVLDCLLTWQGDLGDLEKWSGIIRSHICLFFFVRQSYNGKQSDHN